MGSRQGAGDIGNAIRQGVRVTGVALTQKHTLLEPHVFAYDTALLRLRECDRRLRLPVAELEKISGISQPVDKNSSGCSQQNYIF